MKTGTSDSRKEWFAVGDYKKRPNEVGGMETALPEEVAGRMKKLLTEYNLNENKSLEDILGFHVSFEKIPGIFDGSEYRNSLYLLDYKLYRPWRRKYRRIYQKTGGKSKI